MVYEVNFGRRVLRKRKAQHYKNARPKLSYLSGRIDFSNIPVAQDTVKVIVCAKT